MRINLKLMTLGLMLPMAAQAQSFSDNWTLPFIAGELAPVSHTQEATSTRRAAADGVYYLRPEGAFYQGMRPQNWSYYPVTKIIVTPWQAFTYENRCTTTAQWSIEGKDVSADADGHYTETIEPIPDGYIDHYLPTITAGDKSYTLGEGHENWTKYHGCIAWADSIVEMAVFDPGRVIRRSGTTVYTNFRPLSMTEGLRYNYGSMSISADGDTYYSRGVRQTFEKPMGRLWVQEVTIPAISYAETLLPDGKALTMTISTTDDGETAAATLATLTCTSADILVIGSQNVGGNKVTMASLRFHAADELVIDQPFIVEIEGFQQEGVDIGLAAALIDPCDQERCHTALITLQDENHHDINATTSYADRVPCISIRGMYDGIKMLTDDEALQLTAPTKGGACTQEGGNTPAKIQLKTAIRWNYGLADANYTIEGLPDWLHATVDESRRDFSGGQFGHGLVTLSFTADAAADNTPDREATLYIKGRGVQTTTPIVVRQKGTWVDAITETGILPSDEPDEAIYNLNGQRINKPAKGIYIKGKQKKIKRNI